MQFPAHERPQTDINTMMMLVMATGFTIVWFLLLYFTPIAKGNFVRDLFLGSKSVQGAITERFLVERVIFQGMITWVWALSIASIILKVQRTQQERRFMSDAALPEDLDMTDATRLVEVYDRVKTNPHIRESLGLTRVARVLAMWINTMDMERVAEYAREQAGLDAAMSDASAQSFVHLGDASAGLRRHGVRRCGGDQRISSVSQRHQCHSGDDEGAGWHNHRRTGGGVLLHVVGVVDCRNSGIPQLDG